MIMNNTILTDEEKEIFKKLVRPEIVVNISSEKGRPYQYHHSTGRKSSQYQTGYEIWNR